MKEDFVLPESWCIRPDESQCFTVFDYFKSKDNSFVGGGDDAYEYMWYFTPNRFEKYHAMFNGKANHYGSTEITFDQFKKYVLKENMKTHKITRSQLKEIHDIACSDWKVKIKNITKDYVSEFEDSGELPDSIVNEMFAAATKDQKPVLEKIFPDRIEDKNAFVGKFKAGEMGGLPVKLFGSDISLDILDGLAEDFNLDHLKGRAFFVYGSHSVKLHEKEGCGTVIEINKK